MKPGMVSFYSAHLQHPLAATLLTCALITINIVRFCMNVFGCLIYCYTLSWILWYWVQLCWIWWSCVNILSATETVTMLVFNIDQLYSIYFHHCLSIFWIIVIYLGSPLPSNIFWILLTKYHCPLDPPYTLHIPSSTVFWSPGQHSLGPRSAQLGPRSAHYRIPTPDLENWSSAKNMFTLKWINICFHHPG